MAVGRIETLVVMVPIAAVVAFVGWSAFSGYQESEAKNATARVAGFADAAELTSATAMGITDPKAYRARLKADRDKREAEASAAEEKRIAARAEAEAALYELRRNPAERMTMPAMTWSIGGFGSVGLVTVTIDNGNDFDVKDIGINCTFSGKSGTALSNPSRTIFDVVKAKSKRTFKDFNIGLIDHQSARARCQVETASRRL